MLANQQRLSPTCRNTGLPIPLVTFSNQTENIIEKGVDVNIAVDMLIAAYENQCDTIYLVSSDTDLYQQLNKLRRKANRSRTWFLSPAQYRPGRQLPRNPQLDA